MTPHYKPDYAPEVYQNAVRKSKRKLSLRNLRRPNEKHLDDIKFLWKRFVERYDDEPEFRIRIDMFCGIAASFWIAIFIVTCAIYFSTR